MNPKNKALNKKKGKPEKKFDLVGAIMAHEDGSLDAKGTKELFKHLDAKGMTGKLQGSYGRARENMRRTGFLK